ncbi:type II toxin-antitoxin system VapC family toxin [Methylocystis sp. MJC1]|jgi:tRNA(fMet)-specific endonuclease VapC|uniref:type II toxin-antitoxin system VapC family toxin n=1 Tax=Methylocystis sp. MJC1 TaxID=2654282 RepID=UPI0013EDEC11|nr:type II toxin-antitoxin system VapC family toxin [Methylocystis sp. MJC1]KAF2991933.1 Ribonuclease VapC2 [Methylocystis sp. MJC1]MBU6525422.1 type II toxin-antitoxin system VapC family toxin [Methylocystis sp. MJC1]UZX11914.1 type II toxin-antitoxin system VapC family toxin [Methylocystis sp. MJC1]
MFCLDTNVVIFAINRRRPRIAERLIAEIEARTPMFVPSVVLFELQYGVAKSQRPAQARALLDEFLSAGFETPAFDAEDAYVAGEIRAYLEARGAPIGPFDTLIAAQARRRGAALVTGNRREFERVPGLIVTDWDAA